MTSLAVNLIRQHHQSAMRRHGGTDTDVNGTTNGNLTSTQRTITWFVHLLEQVVWLVLAVWVVYEFYLFCHAVSRLNISTQPTNKKSALPLKHACKHCSKIFLCRRLESPSFPPAQVHKNGEPGAASKSGDKIKKQIDWHTEKCHRGRKVAPLRFECNNPSFSKSRLDQLITKVTQHWKAKNALLAEKEKENDKQAKDTTIKQKSTTKKIKRPKSPATATNAPTKANMNNKIIWRDPIYPCLPHRPRTQNMFMFEQSQVKLGGFPVPVYDTTAICCSSNGVHYCSYACYRASVATNIPT